MPNIQPSSQQIFAVKETHFPKKRRGVDIILRPKSHETVTEIGPIQVGNINLNTWATSSEYTGDHPQAGYTGAGTGSDDQVPAFVSGVSSGA